MLRAAVKARFLPHSLAAAAAAAWLSTHEGLGVSAVGSALSMHLPKPQTMQPLRLDKGDSLQGQ